RCLHRHGSGSTAQRPPLSVGDRRGDDRPRPPRGRDLHPARRLRRGILDDRVRLHQFPARLWLVSDAVDDADRLALRRDPVVGRTGRPVHGRAAGQWLAQRLCRARGGEHRGDAGQRPAPRLAMTAFNGLIVALMAVLFLVFGYLGVPVAFALIAGVVIGTLFTPVSLPSIITQLFNGTDTEA